MTIPADSTIELLDAATRDPADIGFPAMLPMELAMKVATPASIQAAYGITRERFREMIAHPVFQKAYAEAVEALKVEGMSFKVKAKMQAEAFLATSFKMVQNPLVSESVRADLIKNTVRWAGYDAKAVDTGAGGTGFSIHINLGDK